MYKLNDFAEILLNIFNFQSAPFTLYRRAQDQVLFVLIINDICNYVPII